MPSAPKSFTDTRLSIVNKKIKLQKVDQIRNEKNALNPVFCKGEVAFSHLSGGGIFGGFLTRPF